MTRLLHTAAALIIATSLFGAFTLAAQSPAVEQPAHSAAEMRRPGADWLQGYVGQAPLPDSTVLSPPPPATGSAAEARDLEGARSAIALRDSPRWAVAISDAYISASGSTRALSCAAGIAIGPATTPRLDRLLRRKMSDLGIATSAIKRRYQRQRPFVANGEPTCTPEAETMLRSDGSYPSGHSAIGYGWGLILAELIPKRAARIVARGRAFGDSRRICNVHWLSDTEEGRVVAPATVARLHGEPQFRRDMDAVRQELRSAKAKPQQCATQEAALAG